MPDPLAPPASLPAPTDFECLDPAPPAAEARPSPWVLLAYAGLGVGLGVLFVLSEVASWYRIQEMFRFQAFHLYGVIGSAVAVAAGALAGIRRLGLRGADGAPLGVAPKAWGRRGARYWAGGTLFGVGWALLGACPGPVFALVGGGVSVMVAALAAALAGTWAYAALRDRLPH